jgi:hypothetical protein
LGCASQVGRWGEAVLGEQASGFVVLALRV